MKTQKRTMTKDHVEIERYIRGVNCQYNSMKSRWTRKNREARLRNAIRQEKRRLKNEEFRHRIYFKSTLDNMLQARTILFVNPLSGAFGQDIEGS